jgi:carbon-monoxide dehydrogenase small subunit
MARTHVTCTVNGDEVEFLTEPDETLLNALRDDVGLTGVKEGCGTGDCGACSVLLDDRLTCACLVFAPEAHGSTVVTVEGLATAGELHPLQQCFLEGAALQCGVCTPGFLVAAKALLDHNPDPTETEVRYALAGNLCRCTGYDKIIRSVLEAAAQLRAGAPSGVLAAD